MDKQPRSRSTTRGFSRVITHMQTRIRTASESRGFAVSRLLTHWEEIAGANIAEIARPVNISYGRGGIGATLTLLTTGAHAPILEMQKEQVREKVNQCYGYSAISRIKVTQTAPTGFSEGQVSFEYKKKAEKPPLPPEVIEQARQVADGVGNENLRLALETLAANVLNKHKP